MLDYDGRYYRLYRKAIGTAPQMLKYYRSARSDMQMTHGSRTHF